MNTNLENAIHIIHVRKRKDEGKINGMPFLDMIVDVNSALSAVNLAATPDWHNTKNKMPENNDEVLVYSIVLNQKSERQMKPMACFYNDGFQSFDDGFQEFLDKTEITHWMLLPDTTSCL